MANDITVAISGNDIKNGTLIVSATMTGEYSLSNVYVNNSPTLAEIESKYDDRFDDPSYYYGIGNSGVIGV